jgi:DNA polymerase elongation subunit (family B)
MCDFDLGSFYPTIIINNDICPEHLIPDLITKYKEIRDDRLIAKHNGDITLADILKIVVNSYFGKTGDPEHWLFDLLAMLKTTVNGQLLILKWIEKFILNDWKIWSANTDGVTVILPREDKEKFERVCLDLCKELNFEGEFAYYKRYIRRDVNNYLINTNSSKKPYKFKGIFESKKALAKGWDKPIIPIALFNYFINDIPISKTILNHTDIYDFCIAKKIDDKFTNKYYTHSKEGTSIETLQKSVRFFVAKRGGRLYKKEKGTGKMINYVVNRQVEILNKNDRHRNYLDNIDYGYYINETQKIIDLIIKPQLSLF